MKLRYLSIRHILTLFLSLIGRVYVDFFNMSEFYPAVSSFLISLRTCELKKMKLVFFLFFFIFSFSLEQTIIAQSLDGLMPKEKMADVTVDLREPLYSDGFLSTEKGGIISTSQIRVQALHLRYTRQVRDQKFIWKIEGEGDLIVEFGEYTFVGEKLIYDFQTKKGTIYQGKTVIEPWHFGESVSSFNPMEVIRLIMAM